MQKWEYMTLRAFRGEIMSINGRSPGSSGLFGSRKPPKYPEYLDVLGREGWEVVGFALDTTTPDHVPAYELLMKRPIE